MELEQERTARLDAEDVVSRLQEQLAEVRDAEVSARQDAETRLASLTQQYNSIKEQVCLLYTDTCYGVSGVFWTFLSHVAPLMSCRSACHQVHQSNLMNDSWRSVQWRITLKVT